MITLKQLSKNTIHRFILRFDIQKRIYIYKWLCDNNKYNFKIINCNNFILKNMLIPYFKQTRRFITHIFKIIEDYHLHNYFNFNTQWDDIILEHTTYPSYINFSNSIHDNYYYITSNKSLNTLTKLQKFNDYFQRILTIINDTLKDTDNDLMLEYTKNYGSIIIKLKQKDRFPNKLEISLIQSFQDRWDEIYEKRNQFVSIYLKRFEDEVCKFSQTTA